MKFDVVTGTPMTLKQFRVKLAEQLIGNYCSRKELVDNANAHPPPECPCKYSTLTLTLKEYTLCLLQGCLHSSTTKSQYGSAQLVRVVHLFASLENKMAVTVLDYGMDCSI